MMSSSNHSVCYLLTGDIGGTNSRLFLYDTVSSTVLASKTYRNAEYFTVDDKDNHDTDPSVYARKIISPFLQYCFKEVTNIQLDLNCSIIATLASAGMVNNNRVNLTNLGKGVLIDGTAIAGNKSDQYLSKIIICKIINDFVAQGYGCLTLTKKDVKYLYGPSDLDNLPVGPKVCIGAGTGLGECYLTPDIHGQYTCFPSEGGHVEYAPRNALEVELFSYLSTKFASKHRISVERVVSGIGLANVYEFLVKKYPDRVDQEVHKEFEGAGDEQGRVVAVNAKPGSLCEQAMMIMMSAYGCETGSTAIKWIPTGGIFVTGGLTPKNIQQIEGKNTEFMKSYLHKGRVSSLLESIPLFAVMSEDLGVRGVHKAANMEYEKYREETFGSTATKKKMVLSSSKITFSELCNKTTVQIFTALIGSFCLGMMLGKKR